MAIRKVKGEEKLSFVNLETGELTPLPDTKAHEARLDAASQAEFYVKKRWLPRWDAASDGMHRTLMAGVLVLALGSAAIVGAFTKELMARHKSDAELAQAMRTSVPVVNALEVAIDPGKYAGKLVDIIMTPTIGGVFKSGKGLYIAESSGSLSLTIFESAFVAFEQSYGVSTAADIAGHLIGHVIRARGQIQARPNPKDGSTRTSMIISAPGLIQVLSDVPK